MKQHEPTTDKAAIQFEKKDANKTVGGKRPNSGGGSGGYRPNSGRPKGSRNIKTILKEEAAIELAEKAMLKKEILAALPRKMQRSEKALSDAIKEINTEEIEETFKKRVALHSNKLVTALLATALGEQFLYKVVYAEDDLTNKVRRKHVRVTDPEEIQEYLDNPLKIEGSDYYYISTKTPDITAINSLLDRMMGRPTTKIVGPNNSDGSEGPIKIISVNYSPAPVAAPVQIAEQVIHDVIEEQDGN